MLLRFLGTAAGGGVPQWNCACPGCAGARAHPDRRRRHAGLAVGAAGVVPFLVNATPDVREQIEDDDRLRPRARGSRTLRMTVVLTDAELDHTLGIAQLREADALTVCATAPVITALRDRLRLDSVLSPYTELVWKELPLAGSGDTLSVAGLHVDAIPLSSKRPRYAVADPPDDTWVTALHVTDPDTGARAVYAPALAEWSETFGKALAGADCVIVDGTFLDDEEPRTAGFSSGNATGMGHLPITGSHGTAERLAGLGGLRLYTHLNNSNPLNDPDAPEHGRLAELGLAVAHDGLVVEL